MAKGRMEKGENLSIRSWLNTELEWKEGQNGHGIHEYFFGYGSRVDKSALA
jgi:hypothetical protein